METENGLRTRRIFEGCVENASAEALEMAKLPFESINADVTLVSGTDDGVWHASEMAETIVEELEASPGLVTHHCYEGAGHSIFLPYHPTTCRAVSPTQAGPDIVNGGTAIGSANADIDSWELVTGFFRRLR